MSSKVLSAYECDTYSDARSLNGGHDFIFVRGCSKLGDGGEGLFMWIPGDTAEDDGGTILRPATTPTGNWRRVYEQIINVRWFGARGDGTNQTAAINAAIDVANNPESYFEGMTVLFPAGNYVVDSLAPIARDGTHLRGAGVDASVIQFAPTSDPASCVTFATRSTAGAYSDLYNCSIRDLAFAASGDTGRQKIAIDAYVTSGLLVENVVVTLWTGGGNACPSMAIRTNGHEMTTIRKAFLWADRPISIEINPRDRTIDADHFHFQDLNLKPLLDEESCIAIASTVHMNNFTLDGTNAFGGGLHGIKFVDTSPDPASCNYINISNIRREESCGPGYTIMFGLWGRQMLNVSIKNVAADLQPARGFYFRNVRVLTLENSTYPGTDVALDMDGALDQGGNAGQGCWDVALLNTFFQTGSIISAPNMVRVLGLQRYNTAAAPFMWFDTTTDLSPVGISLGGNFAKGTLVGFVNIVTGVGQPTGSFPGDLPVGSLYLNQAGGAGATLFVKEGTGSPGGWKEK